MMRLSCRLIARSLHIRQRFADGTLASLNTTTGEFKREKKDRFTFLNAFMPARGSLHPCFLAFSASSFMASVCSSIGGVLSIQSLLMAASNISPSVGTGIGLAATINWILKDGLGQLGGVLFSAKFAPRFDLNPRFFRFYSMFSLQVGSFLEIITAVLPAALFLPVAAIANIAKNISWMGMSATRTKIMEEYQLNNNIAELTAKHWSQVVAASVVGTGGGILVSLCGSWCGIPTTAFNIVMFPLFGAASLYFTYISCKFVNMSNLTIERVKMITADILRDNLEYFKARSIVKCINAVKAPGELALKESFLRPFEDPFPTVHINPPLTENACRAIQEKAALKSIERFNKDIILCVTEGNYCIWVSKELESVFLTIPIIMIACYCSAVFRGISEGKEMSEKERTEQMVMLFEKSFDTYSQCALEIARGMVNDKGWVLTSDFIPVHNRIYSD